jgi:hypothetical protein
VDKKKQNRVSDQVKSERVGTLEELLKLDPKKVKSIRVVEPRTLKLPKLAKAPPKI